MKKIAACLFLLLLFSSSSADAVEPSSRVVAIPYLGSAPPPPLFQPAIFWFGKVTPTTNYVDVRTHHYDNYVRFIFHVFDESLWYDSTPSASDLTRYDAISMYVVVNGTTYRFEKQLSDGDISGSKVSVPSVPFTATTGWRGNALNDQGNDRGWTAEFEIPFTSVGLSGKPTAGSVWSMGMALHDRDDSSGTAIPVQTWPEQMDASNSQTWGSIVFGISSYTPPSVANQQTVTVQNGFNGATVLDAAVGGHSTCGGELDYWSEWGEANYGSYPQFNIQNQWDVADFPCFSKYYVTFPLSSLPAGKAVVSGKVILNMFGNAGFQVGDAKVSAINVIELLEDWDVNTVSWNSAPLAGEHISTTWVDPIDPAHPAGPHAWDVSRAFFDAYQTGQPLRLVFYSTDGDMHSGKYFYSSDTTDWNGTVRPKLEVVLGDSPTLSPTVSPTTTLKPGDVNGDGFVTLTDLSTLLANFGGTNKARNQGDLDGNGMVNLSDLSTLLANFGA
jgi:hypothetical protein